MDLDPKPWLFVSDQVFGEHRSDHDKGPNDVAGTWWAFSPRENYEQDREAYSKPEKPANKPKVQIISERMVLPVRQSWGRGGPDSVDVNVCPTCSAIIFDPVVHYEWHTDHADGSRA